MATREHDVLEAARMQGECWNGVRSPGDVATRQAHLLGHTWRGFVDLRSALVFEDEPASFDRVLSAWKEVDSDK